MEEVILNFSSLTKRDVANIALQRTSSLVRLPGVGRLSYLVWKRGQSALLDFEASFRRNAILGHVAAEIEREFNEVAEYLSSMPPKRIVDIGLGHAIIDLFFWNRYHCDIHLVDIEETEERHHEFNESGAGYASLSSAAEFLTANGVPRNSIRVTNPLYADLIDKNVDLVFSFLSCGFHYPALTYLPFLESSLSATGRFIFDLRKDSEQDEFLERFSKRDVIKQTSKYTRLAVSW
ncbi:hypothetical protein MCEMIH16_01639 [Caulobacteraceae bacterium]